MKKWLFGILILAVASAVFTIFSNKEQYVVLVSMDAFRWDYDQIYNTPNLDRFSNEGVKAKSLVASFPTMTFPNHYSIATGLYPDNHGLINNTFYAPDLEKLYRIGDRSMVENGDFYGGEPIWTTAEKNGIIAASMFWVGSEAAINGHQPTYWSSYDGSIPYGARVDSVINWLSLPKKERPGFITLYFDEPDASSHSFGPVSEETGYVVTKLDSIIGSLQQRILDLPIGKRVNIILVSDHGMGEVSSDKLVNLKDVVPEELVEYFTGGNPVILIDPVDEYQDSVLNILNSIPHVKGWSAETLPDHYHYGTNPRFPGLIAEADSGWSIVATNRPGYSMNSKGAHGYDPANFDMHGIFYADGPAFKDAYLGESIENVDIYNIICRIFGIDPEDNDGDIERVERMFLK
jgi:predicted AlkP superfamily pyrophosphatase or phosphodiesterase